MNSRTVRTVLALAAAFFVAAFDDMSDQNRPKAYGVTPTPLPVPGTVSRAAPPVPPALTLALIQRGRERFDIFCSPCHGRLGDGKGIVVQRGFPAPPSFHEARLRAAPSQHFYDVITNGYGAMYSYAARVTPEDRWAIVAYIRALQESQHVAAADLSAETRKNLP